MRLLALFGFAILAALPAPAFSQGANDREPGDTRVMSCARHTASLLVLSREVDAEADNLKAEPGGGFSPSTRAFMETLCPKVRRHTAAVDRDCDELKNSDDIAKHFPRVEALMFARRTVPFCDQFFKPVSAASPPAPASAPSPPPAAAKETGEDEAEAVVNACIGKLKDALQLQWGFTEYFTKGAGKAHYESGQITPRISRYYARFCPKLRNVAPFRELLCMGTLAIVNLPVEKPILDGVVAFTNDIIGLCDKHYPPNTLGAAEYQRLFDREVSKNRYPETVSAVCENGLPRYSAVFEPFPKGRFGFYAHHGASDEAFRRQDTNYTAAGLQRVWHNRIECGGRPYNQGVWIPK
jgi:hypothetical protein